MGTNDLNKMGKGGDGGKVIFIGPEISGKGKIIADGGDGSIGGEGGEVQMHSVKNEFAGEISVKGGESLSTKESSWTKWGTIGTYVGIFVSSLQGLLGLTK